MNFNAGKWVSQTLSDAIASAAGLRMFVSISTSSTPTDSAVIHLAIPIDGIVMGSGNDGPIDDAWISPTTVVRSALRTSSPASRSDRAGSVIGDSVTASLSGAQSSAPTRSRASFLRAGRQRRRHAGRTRRRRPVSLDLAPGARGTMAWTLRSDADRRRVSLAASVSGTEQGTGIVQRSVSTSRPTRIGSTASRTTSTSSRSPPAPLTVLRGQKKVAPFTLTFSNPGDAAAVPT